MDEADITFHRCCGCGKEFFAADVYLVDDHGVDSGVSDDYFEDEQFTDEVYSSIMPIYLCRICFEKSGRELPQEEY